MSTPSRGFPEHDEPFPLPAGGGNIVVPHATALVADAPPPTVATGRRLKERRSGRDLPVAIGVGVGLGALVAASLFIRKEAFVVLAAAAIVLAVWELANAMRARRIRIPVVPVVVGAVAMIVSAFVGGQDALLIAFALTCVAVLLWRIIDGPKPVRDVTAGIFTAAYVPYLAGFAVLMLAQPDGAYRVLTFLMVAIASDIGGYAVGTVFGKHPLAPSVSPKKSWEGMVGSFALAMSLGAVCVVLALDGPWYAGALLGAAIVVAATVGDLSESLLKRDLGIKDMGSLLPGHGGIMDRLDSLLLSAPVAYLLLAIFVPITVAA